MDYFEFINDVGKGIAITAILLACIFGPVVYWLYRQIRSWF